jgi:hypothetical protein
MCHVECCNTPPCHPGCYRPAAPVDAVQLEEAAVARVQAAVAERFAAAIASEEVSRQLCLGAVAAAVHTSRAAAVLNIASPRRRARLVPAGLCNHMQ